MGENICLHKKYMAETNSFEPNAFPKKDIFTIPDDVVVTNPEVTEQENLFRNMRTWPSMALVNLKYGSASLGENISNEGWVQMFEDVIPTRFADIKELKALLSFPISDQTYKQLGITEENLKNKDASEVIDLKNNPNALPALKMLAELIQKYFSSQS